MPILPIQVCSKDKCNNKKLLFLNPSISTQRVKNLKHSQILQTKAHRRLGCGNSGKIPLKDSKGVEIRDDNGEIIYITGCEKAKQGLTYAPYQPINNYGKTSGGSIDNVKNGGLTISNFR